MSSNLKPSNSGERLQKILANAGMASRRAAEEMIAAGRVRVNGKIVTEMGVRADPGTDRIEVDGKPIASPKAAQHTGTRTITPALVYIILNKPAGIVTTAKDTHGRTTVLDILTGARLQERGLRLYPVGRLDADTTGLLLITNDGDLTFRMTHPRYGVEKEYRVLVRGHPNPVVLKKLREGVEIEEGKQTIDDRPQTIEASSIVHRPSSILTAPARVEVLGKRGEHTWLRIVIHEGRKRQVRLMAAAVGHPVIELQRVRFGSLSLGNLGLGQWRYLAIHEVHALRKAVGLKAGSRVRE